MITPFHFACHAEERLRAQAAVIDAPLGRYLQVVRRTSLTENHAALNFGRHVEPGEEFAAHVTLSIHLVPQKDEKTAFNCVLSCPSEKMTRSFRLLVTQVEETENDILRILQFLQKAFAPQDYVKNAPAASAEEILPTMPAPVAGSGSVKAPNSIQAAAPKKKYVFEKEIAPGDTVRMRTHEGKYVPEGELPARLRINKPGETNPPVTAAAAETTTEATTTTVEAAAPAEAPATPAAPAAPSGETQA